jgi:hypothetical protein
MDGSESQHVPWSTDGIWAVMVIPPGDSSQLGFTQFVELFFWSILQFKKMGSHNPSFHHGIYNHPGSVPGPSGFRSLQMFILHRWRKPPFPTVTSNSHLLRLYWEISSCFGG